MLETEKENYLRRGAKIMRLIKSPLLILSISMTVNVVAQEEFMKPAWLDTAKFTLEQLNYNTCKIVNHRDEAQPLKSLDLKPAVMGGILKEAMCERSFNRCTAGSPPSRICGDLESVRRGGKNVWELKPKDRRKNIEELDFDDEVMKFLAEHQSTLASCEPGARRDDCFGQGLVWNGLYVGDWKNNQPNGKGIQLITREVPMGFERNVWNSIYKGMFKDGMFHGEGRFFSVVDSYEGNWFRGEMHGHIEWEWPIEYKFGFGFARSQVGITVTEVALFSAAYEAGLKVNDTIVSIETLDQEFLTSEVGLRTIGQILAEIGPTEPITIKKLDLVNDQSSTLTFSKSETNLQDQATFFCMSTQDQKCYEKSKLRNTLIRDGALSRGSFFMGTRHAYTNNDITVRKAKDGTSQWDLFCHGRGQPNLILSKDEEVYERIKYVTPSSFILESEYTSPCEIRGTQKANTNTFYFPHVLKESAQDMDLIVESTGLLKIDVLDYLAEFIEQLDAGNFPHRIQNNIVHSWCEIPVIASKYCNKKAEDSQGIARYIVRKALEKPNRLGQLRQNELELIRAEENYITLAKCKSKYPDSYQDYQNFRSCVDKDILYNNAFWECVPGYGMTECSSDRRGPTEKVFEKYKLLNPEVLNGVDLNEWKFGEL